MDTIHFYNRHFIRVDKYNRILHGFSDAFETAEEGDICINENGSHQFRLFFDEEENPSLIENHIHLYMWTGEEIRETTPEEREAELKEIEASRPLPALSLEEKIDLIGMQLSALMLESMSKSQTVEAIGAQLAQVSLEVMELKST